MDVQKLQGMIIEARQSMAVPRTARSAEVDVLQRLQRIERAILQLAEVHWALLSEVNAQSRWPR